MAAPIIVVTSLIVTFLFYIMMFGGAQPNLNAEPKKLPPPIVCNVPECDASARVNVEEYGWHLCKDHGKWFDQQLAQVERNFPDAIDYLLRYDDWRFQAELQNYPEGCYDNMLEMAMEKEEH